MAGVDQNSVDKSTEVWLDGIEDRMEYKKWYCGHYHVNRIMDQKHIVLFEEIIPLEW